LSFEGTVAVVTGAASGIGLATARRFAENRAKVAMIDLDAARGEDAVNQIRATGGVCEFFAADVSRERDTTAVSGRVVERFGRIDHLVNNAGIVISKPIEESTVEDWDRVMDVNVKSVFLMTRSLLGALRSSPAASIVNLGSVSSFVGQKHTPIYVASKGAVAMLSKALALDLSAYGIRVNCVCPGITDTPMFRRHAATTPDPEQTVRERRNRVPLNRLLAPAEIANAILFLCSREAGGITGTTLVVDAGYLAAAEWANT
jgi:NAD(P)-dependent dehydrogenase (short-subunit alcohol dehydrogenase family)